MLGFMEITKIVKKKKRVGRGGKRGKSCGRGRDGQLCRSGSRSEIKPWFEGGQMPLSRRIPRRGFTPLNKIEYSVVDIAKINESFVDGANIDHVALAGAGLVKLQRNLKVKVLGNSEVNKKFILAVNAISKTAKAKIEEAGGVVNFIDARE